LKNYILIRLVNVMESQLQTETVFLIDNFELEPSVILQKNEIKVSLHELDIFRQGDTTDGKIVTQEFKFANIRSVNRIFSNINNLNFFSLLEELFPFPIEEELGYVLKLRNDVVHNLLDVEWKPKELKQNIKRVKTYSHMFFIISWINLEIQLKNSKNIESVCKEKTGQTVVEFSKTAKKHKRQTN